MEGLRMRPEIKLELFGVAEERGVDMSATLRSHGSYRAEKIVVEKLENIFPDLFFGEFLVVNTRAHYIDSLYVCEYEVIHNTPPSLGNVFNGLMFELERRRFCFFTLLDTSTIDL